MSTLSLPNGLFSYSSIPVGQRRAISIQSDTPRRSSSTSLISQPPFPPSAPPCRFHHTVPRAYCASPSYNGTYQYPGNLREPAPRVCVLCLQVPQCPPLIARSWTVWNAAISSSPFFPPSLCLSLPAGWPLL